MNTRTTNPGEALDEQLTDALSQLGVPPTRRDRRPAARASAAVVALCVGGLAVGLSRGHEAAPPARDPSPSVPTHAGHTPAERTAPDQDGTASRETDVDGDGKPDLARIASSDQLTVRLSTGETESVDLQGGGVGQATPQLLAPVTIAGTPRHVLLVRVFEGDMDELVPIAVVGDRLVRLRVPSTPVLGEGPGTATEASSFRIGYGYGVYGDRLVSWETRDHQGVARASGAYWTWQLTGDRLVAVDAPGACSPSTPYPLC
jgi:hypothetical protein